MRPNSKLTSIASKGIVTVTLSMLTLLTSCHGRPDKDNRERQVQEKKAVASVSIENGRTVLTLDTQAQNRLGLEIQTLAATVTRAEITAPAVVLPIQDLVTFRNAYIATQSQLQKSRAEGEVAKKEHARLQTLYEQNHNISEKSLQSAEGSLEANESDVRAGEQQLYLQESAVRQEWGSVVGKWATEGSPDLQSILEQREVLVQMTMPSDSKLQAPGTISLETPGGTQRAATFVSAFPRVDPRIQGRSLLYRTAARPDLVPGVNLLAHLAIGSQMQGVVVPPSAVVWSEGKAWVYQQTATDHFIRTALPTNSPVEGGFFASPGFEPGNRVVTQGAQALLSEELLLHGQGGGETDEN